MRRSLLLASTLTLALAASSAAAAYEPGTLALNRPVTERLTANDAPASNGGVSRDYRVALTAGSFVIVSVKSEDFDTTVELFGPNRSSQGSNDDGPNGGTDSLLVAEVSETGNYIVRVGSFSGGGDAGLGQFTIRVLQFENP